MYQVETRRMADGAPARNLSVYSKWRKTARIQNLELLAFYGTFLAGQYNGSGHALSLPSLHAAFLLEGISKYQWPELSRKLLFVHTQIVATLPKEK